jgi:EAL domain-containing protein (putative c-di-GMP-specific phosphodiesterase class I)
VVTIATELGIAVVAEGVETAEQAAALTRVGCGYGQGFLYGGPTPRMSTV